MHGDATLSGKPVRLVQFLPLSRDPLLEANEAQYEFGLSMIKQLHDNRMRLCQQVGIGAVSNVAQDVFVRLEERLTQAQGCNPEASFEWALLGIAFDIQIQQLVAQRLRVPVENKQRLKLRGIGRLVFEQPADRQACQVLSLDRVMAGHGGPKANRRRSVERARALADTNAGGKISSPHVQAIDPAATCGSDKRMHNSCQQVDSIGEVTARAWFSRL